MVPSASVSSTILDFGDLLGFEPCGYQSDLARDVFVNVGHKHNGFPGKTLMGNFPGVIGSSCPLVSGVAVLGRIRAALLAAFGRVSRLNWTIDPLFQPLPLQTSSQKRAHRHACPWWRLFVGFWKRYVIAPTFSRPPLRAIFQFYQVNSKMNALIPRLIRSPFLIPSHLSSRPAVSVPLLYAP